MLNLSDSQLEFLKKELNISAEEIEKMTVEQWRDVRFECFLIESDEAMDIPEDTCILNERGETAASIADTKFKELNN